MKITVRLWIYITLIVAMVLGLVWLCLIVLFPQTYFDEATMRLSSEFGVVTQALEDEFPDDLSAHAHEELARISLDGELRIELLGLDGSTLAQAGWGENWRPLSQQELELVLDGNALTKSVYHTGFGEALVYAGLIHPGTGSTFVLVVCAPLAPVLSMLEILAQQMLVIIAASLLVSMGVAWFASRSFVRPIQKLDALALSIAQGEFGRTVKTHDSSELGDLTRTINSLSSQLGQVEAMRRDFIATVSHQFKTPLSIIQGHVELIADSLPEEETRRFEGAFQLILDEISKLDAMAKDMLELSRYQAGSVVLHKKPLAMEPFLEDIRNKFAVLDGGVELVVNAERGLLALADPVMLAQAVENFVQNALRHASASRIELAAEARDGRYVHVCVRDNGAGLTEQQLLHIWDRFSQRDSRNRSGSGLGMAISREILMAHDAAYGITAEQGTTVWFSLPRVGP